MYSIRLAVEDQLEYKKLYSWIIEEFNGECVLIEEGDQNSPIDIAIIEVRKWLDWVKLHRFRKRNHECRIIPLLDPCFLHTSPLAVEFKLNHLLIKSVKKHVFLRMLKRAMGELAIENSRLTDHGELFGEIQREQKAANHGLPCHEPFLRRMLSGELTEEEFIQSHFSNPDQTVPNIVCFIQGFVRDPERREREDWHAPRIIQQAFRRHFQDLHLSFLSYQKHLLMLIQVPSEYASLRHWKDGENKILSTIEALERDYGIFLYIGVGSIYREPVLLHHSYREACKARRTTWYDRLSLRFYEDIPKDEQMQKCMDYIARHCTEDLSIKQVADHINLSVPHFSRIFKQETGRKFVEYVTYVRLQRAVWLLRHTNHTIEWVAEELGFNTPNYFSCIFKKYVGLPPREYRATEEIIFI